MAESQADSWAMHDTNKAPQAPFSTPALPRVPSLPALALSPNWDRAARIRGISSIKATAAADTLVLRIATTDDPWLLWALHLKLDSMGLPPSQRWPIAGDHDDQADFITLLADLLWLHRRLPFGHRAKYRGWRDLLAQAPNSTRWHEHALRQFMFIAARGSIAHWCAVGLGLTDAQRADTLMLPTATMRAAHHGFSLRRWPRSTASSWNMRQPTHTGRAGTRPGPSPPGACGCGAAGCWPANHRTAPPATGQR